MSRGRTETGSYVDGEIAARTARGESAEIVFAALNAITVNGKSPISLSTIRRRQRELKQGETRRGTARHGKAGQGKAGALTRESTDPAGLPEQVPTEASAETIDVWLDRCEKWAITAETNGNIQALASIAAKVTALLALKHRSKPLAQLDPSDDPDFVSLGKQGEERFMTIVRALEGSAFS